MRSQPIARHLDDVTPIPCPCGFSTRIITAADDAAVGFHVTDIGDAQPHFHRRGTEIYFVLEGAGRLITDGVAHDVAPGTVAYIPPGCVHNGEGRFRAAIALLPAFDPEDEFSAADEPSRPKMPPIIRALADVTPIRSACGSSTRVLTRADGVAMGLHVVHITEAECHYHTRTTEIYHILEGEGALRVGEEEYTLRPGLTVYVPAGLPHGGEGDFRSIVICAPPFDPEDQVMV
jgi:mannose-6-phosphate isomerase-like protein (cupin superfamily)